MESGIVLHEDDGHRRTWLEATRVYLKETQKDDFRMGTAPINSQQLESLLKYFSGSRVKDLDLSFNRLENKMDTLTQVLVNSEIQSLNISSCSLTKQDLFKLMEVLKDSKLAELNIESNKFGMFSVDERDRFISLLQSSRLTIFKFDFEYFYEAGLAPLFDALMDTKITRLHFLHDQCYGCLSPLLSHLPRHSLTELGFEEYKFSNEALKILSQAIRNPTLKKLDLSYNDLTDEGVDILVEGLIHSTITELDLKSNEIRGGNSLGFHLKDTCIEVLNLGYNSNYKLFQKFTNGLKLSKVVVLNLACTTLDLPQVSEFAQILKDTNLERIDLPANYLSRKALSVLAEGVKNSKLCHIDLSYGVIDEGILPSFFSKLKMSSVSSLILCDTGLKATEVKTLALQLENSTLTYLDLSENPVGDGVKCLAEHLKFSNLSNLFLNSCEITDEGVKIIAKHLKETQLVELDLDSNEITDNGAKTLALSLRESCLLYLHIDYNKIKDDGIKALAEGAENTFMCYVSVLERNLYFEPVLWRCKVSGQRLINFFKCIAPEDDDNNFRFTPHSHDMSVDLFLEECLRLYRNITQRPSAIHVLLDDKSITLDREEIDSLMFDEFPRQFSLLIAEGIDTDVTEHVGLLKKAEDWGLSKVVELLLLNRPLYMIDKNEGILDPYVYKLLNKYNYPICNLDIEPEGRQKLIRYFTEHNDLEGASDVVRFLCKRKM